MERHFRRQVGVLRRLWILLRRLPSVVRVAVACLMLAEAGSLAAQSPVRPPSPSVAPLQQFSDSIQALSAQVSPGVVQVLVTRYGQREAAGGTGYVVGRQQVIGSGVLVDPDGYIMTNAHVVEDAEAIQVRLSPKGLQSISQMLGQTYAEPQTAKLVGMFKEADLALLKIAGTGLPALPFADYRGLRQGELVFTLGSPRGLQNSISMGIVSSVARQPDPDSPWIYIQTDAPINPGNSGGPLLNAKGEIVGLNTFIVTESGGSEGIGFAIPSRLVEWVYHQLREYGHVHRPVMGLGVQAITPALAAALKLPRSSGVVVSDVLPGSPAESAGVKVNDVLVSMDNVPVDNVAAMLGATIRYGAAHTIKLEVLRGAQTLTFDVQPVLAPDEPDRLAQLVGNAQTPIPGLGILAIEVNSRTASVAGHLRIASGVIVVARLDDPGAIDTGLLSGDVIHAVNRTPIQSVEALRASLAEFKRGDPVALQIERNGQLQYLTFIAP